MIKYPYTHRTVEIDYFGLKTPEELEELDYQFRYTEIVDMKCIKCGFEIEVPFDAVLECEEYSDEEYPCLSCTKCNRYSLVPKDIFEQIKEGYYYPFH